MRVIVGREGLFKTIFVNPGCREFDLRHQSRLIRYQLIERILNRLKQAPLAFVFLGFSGSFGCRFGWLGGGLLGGALVVEGQQALEDLFAGDGADGVADAVVFCQGFHLVEVVAKVEVGPVVGVADGVVQLAVQVAQFEDGLVAGFGLFRGFFADLGDVFGAEVAAMEEIVDVGEAEPELEHETAAMFVVVLAGFSQVRVGGLPEPLRKGEGFKTIRWGIAEPCFQRPAVLACPDLVQGGLDYGEEIPTIGGEDVECVGKDIICWYC